MHIIISISIAHALSRIHARVVPRVLHFSAFIKDVLQELKYSIHLEQQKLLIPVSSLEWCYSTEGHIVPVGQSVPLSACPRWHQTWGTHRTADYQDTSGRQCTQVVGEGTGFPSEGEGERGGREEREGGEGGRGGREGRERGG